MPFHFQLMELHQETHTLYNPLVIPFRVVQGAFPELHIHKRYSQFYTESSGDLLYGKIIYFKSLTLVNYEPPI